LESMANVAESAHSHCFMVGKIEWKDENWWLKFLQFTVPRV